MLCWDLDTTTTVCLYGNLCSKVVNTADVHDWRMLTFVCGPFCSTYSPVIVPLTHVNTHVCVR